MRRIVVVDDDAAVSQVIGLWLKQHGFRVSTADGGPSGVAALDNGTFDLMIVDVFMPDMRGFEAIRLFHRRAPSVPLVAISGSAFPETDGSAREFLRLGTSLGAGILAWAVALRWPRPGIALLEGDLRAAGFGLRSTIGK